MTRAEVSDWIKKDRKDKTAPLTRDPPPRANALKAGEWFRRGRLLMVSPVHGDYRRCQAEIPLIVLFRFPGPALVSKLMKRSEGSLRQKARVLGIGLGHQR